MPIQVISFYRFQKLDPEQINRIADEISKLDKKFDLRGLFILGTEGINCTLSVQPDQAESVKSIFCGWFGDIFFKDSICQKHPFHDLKVRIRDEIVTLHRPDLQPPGHLNHHVHPNEWQQALNEPDTIVIDTRNSYEYDIGHFQGAINPNTREFATFPKWLANSEIPKDKKILIYCTGGIRCEKAILEMAEQGYNNVHQLEGGILNYLREINNQNLENKFDGECFVFDYRVAVDQKLQPTNLYKLCPHCGQPAKEKVNCAHCGTQATVCSNCLNERADKHTCSKNCAHHLRMGHRRRNKVLVDSHRVET